VFGLNASGTSWKLSCSLLPHSDMTLIVVPGATVVLAPGDVLPPGAAVGEHAATKSAATATKANIRADPLMRYLLGREISPYVHRSRTSGEGQGRLLRPLLVLH